MKVNNNSPVVNLSAEEARKKNQLSVDDFLRIMAAEISNQNPLDGGSGGGGGSNTDYLTQLAQFTTLEQMTEINEGISQLNMISQTALIGKEVTLYGKDGDIEGIVESVKFHNNQTYLQVGGEDYPLGLLIKVEESEELKPLEEALLELIGGNRPEASESFLVSSMDRVDYSKLEANVGELIEGIKDPEALDRMSSYDF